MTAHSSAEATLDKVLALSMLVTADMARFEAAERVTGPRLHLLWQLGISGPCTQRALADALVVSGRLLWGVVVGLVVWGLVRGVGLPTDRRATLVTPTPAGAAFVARLRASHVDLAEQLFGHMTARQLAAFTRGLDETLERFARLVDGDQP
jgi:DNA-binding MarR family transcriptional regulator